MLLACSTGALCRLAAEKGPPTKKKPGRVSKAPGLDALRLELPRSRIAVSTWQGPLRISLSISQPPLEDLPRTPKQSSIAGQIKRVAGELMHSSQDCPGSAQAQDLGFKSVSVR